MMAGPASAGSFGSIAGNPRLWLLAAILLAVMAAYWTMVRWLRRRAASRIEQPSAGDGGFSPEELERYARHIVLREIGGAGQQRLRNSSVLVVGAGGLGSPSLFYLAAAGIGRIAIIDDDSVSMSNLQRQIIHDGERIGAAKVDSAADTLERLNPGTEIVRKQLRLTEDNLDELAGYDVILDGSDNFATRQLVNRYCHAHQVPLIFGAISQWEGQVSVFRFGRGPCLACVFPEEPGPGLAPGCAEGGVLGALPGVIGSMMAVETIKLLAGAGQVLESRLFIYDALWGENRTIKLRKRQDCRVCGRPADGDGEA